MAKCFLGDVTFAMSTSSHLSVRLLLMAKVRLRVRTTNAFLKLRTFFTSQMKWGWTKRKLYENEVALRF